MTNNDLDRHSWSMPKYTDVVSEEGVRGAASAGEADVIQLQIWAQLTVWPRSAPGAAWTSR
jgi:hypothetical protein